MDGRVYSAQRRPGEKADVPVRVSRSASGTALLTIERFDPFVGWMAHRQRTVTVRDGTAHYRWAPPAVGRWRIRAVYNGSRHFAPSGSGFARLLVARPLQE